MLSRRGLLKAAGLMAVGGGLVLLGPGSGAYAGAAPLTASALQRMRGQRVEVTTATGRTSAVVADIQGNGTMAVQERSFMLVLNGDEDLPIAGGTIEVRHDEIGRHLLFAVPGPDRSRWFVVVQDLEALVPTGGR